MNAAPPLLTTGSPLPPRLRKWLAAGWVAFLSASAGLAPIVLLMDQVVEYTGGDPRAPVPLGIYSLAFLALWLVGLMACWLLIILQTTVRRGPPSD